MFQAVAIVVSLAVTVVAVALFVRAITQILQVLRLGQPAHRTDQPLQRSTTLVRESLGHTRMLQWSKVGAAHWFIMLGFGLLFLTLVNAFGQLFDPRFALPLVGHFPPFEWVTEFFAAMMVLTILPLMIYRYTRPKDRVRGVSGRFYGSTMWQGYFVEWVILTVGLCILGLRFLEYALGRVDGSDHASALHFPLTSFLGQAFTGLSAATLATAIIAVAMLKILISFTWMIVISLNPTMGVAWHRFLAFFNIWFKRQPDPATRGGVALGPMPPMVVDGRPFDMEQIEEIDEDTSFGVGKVEDFSWKGLLDFSTCTECGRCQSQCPAWNTDKPLSPKLLITNLRDHAHAKAPYLLAAEEARPALPEPVRAEASRELVGATVGDPWAPSGGAVIDPEVLWSCTSCGACVQQCPVDIEHVDHVMDMRRYQVLVESNFPAELTGLFRGLETKGNPWNMSPTARMEWAKDLSFGVKQVGGGRPGDPETLDEVEWLFWVGCAGAYEDRAKKTTAAVAELLEMAGVSFAVLGDGETCSGDPARRAGNEFVFQQLAQQNAEVFTETRAKKVVSTCAHCFNTLKNEYSQLGVELEVVHHTQLLNRLVREGRLTPIAPSTGSAHGASNGSGRTLTYHDPCYLGRHNKVYEPPRELLSVIPSTTFTEMERHGERSFCCGAGGARMWMEERIGERINVNRTTEAVGTGADQIATGCPFCRVMLSDGLTLLQSQGEAREEVEVLDVAQLLLASVKPAARAVGGAAAPNDEEADDTGFPLTTAHDHAHPDQTATSSASPKLAGATDPGLTGAEVQPEARSQPATQVEDEPAQPAVKVEDVQAPPAQPEVTTSAARDPEPAPRSTGRSTVGSTALSPPTSAPALALAPMADPVSMSGTETWPVTLRKVPDGQTATTDGHSAWSGRDLESILEDDDMDISEFKARLKAELKAEVLAELKDELAGALNSDGATSQPVEYAATSQPPPSAESAQGAQATPAESAQGAQARTTPAASTTAARDDDDDDDLLIGSL